MDIPTPDEILRMRPFPKVRQFACSDEASCILDVLVGDTHNKIVEHKVRELIPVNRYLAIWHTYIAPEFRADFV